MNQYQKDRLASFAVATEKSLNALVNTVTLMGNAVDTLTERVNNLEVQCMEPLLEKLKELDVRAGIIEALQEDMRKGLDGSIEAAETTLEILEIARVRVENNEKSIESIETLLTTTDKLRNQFLAGNDEATKQEFLRLLSDHVRKTQ